MLFDSNQLLLTNKTMPATQRLRVLRRVFIIRSHIFAHKICRISSNIDARFEAILSAHSGGVLGVDVGPR